MTWNYRREQIIRNLALAGSLLAALNVSAALLDKSAWEVTGPDGKRIKTVTDNDLQTVWQAPGPQVTGQSVLIDMKEEQLVQRVVLDPGASVVGYPRSLDIYAGPTPAQLILCGQMQVVPEEAVKVITFNPVKARYVRLTIGKEQAGYPWVIAEVDVYGHANTKALEEGNCVVVDANAPEVVQMAAEDLGFYLGQVTEGAFPVVSVNEANYHTGLHFRVRTPSPVATNLPFQQALSLEHFSISRKGNEIEFWGETERAVWYAVKEVLERHGVRWTYGAAHSDLIPAKRALDLAFLPCRGQPPVYVRMGGAGRESMRSELRRCLIRNGVNAFNWGGGTGLGAASALQQICFASTHTMGYVFGDDWQKNHPEWYAGTSNKTGWCVVPDVTAPGLVDFIVNRFKEEGAKKSWIGFGLHPLDVPAWAVSERSEKLLGPFPKTDLDGTDEAAMNFDYSNLYGHLMEQTAKKMLTDMPGKLLAGTAYENHHLAPSKIGKFPPNMFMLICLHDQPYNLPLTSPRHVKELENLQAWGKKCPMLGVWDYILLDEHARANWHPPTPLMTALVDRYGWLAKHGFCYLFSQGLVANDIDNPWNGYAFARVLYNPDVKIADVIDEFFAGYYKEAAEPMKQYYATFENYLLEHDVGIQGYVVHFSYEPTPEAFPPELVAKLKQCLADARQAARHGFVKERVGHAEECLNWAVDFIKRR